MENLFSRFTRRKCYSFLDLIRVVIAAILFYLSFPSYFKLFGFQIFAWIFAIPFYYALKDKSFWARFVFGVLFGLIAYSSILSWMANVNIFIFILFVVIFSVQPLVFSVLFKVNYRNRIINVLYLPALWVLSEFIRTLLLGGFTWTVGFSQSYVSQLIQISDITGAYGLSFLIILINSCIYFVLTDRRNAVIYSLVGAISLVFVILYGVLVINNDVVSNQYSVCTIQPNISIDEKLNPGLIDAVVDEHVALSYECYKENAPDLIVWNETSITDDFIKDEILREKIFFLKSKVESDLLIGTALLIDGEDYNSAVLLGGVGEVKGIYHKKKLLPFNEYLPFSNKLSFLKDVFNLSSYDFQKGSGVGLFALKEKRGEENLSKKFMGVTICSEDGYPALFRELVQGNAAFIITMLNDAWFNNDAGLMMHSQNGIMNAAAFKTPVIRSSNSGLSCHIDKYGRIQKRDISIAALNKKSIFYYVINVDSQDTFYRKFGDVFAFLCGVFVVIALAVSFKKETFKKRRSA